MQFPVWQIILISMAITAVSALIFRVFLLPTKAEQQTIQRDMEDRVWQRSQAAMNRMDSDIAKRDATIEKLSGKIDEFSAELHELRVGVTVLTTQLIENSIIPKWPDPIPHKVEGGGTTITVNAGIDVSGDVVGRDKSQGGVNLDSDVK